MLDEGQAPTNAAIPSYAQVIGVVNKSARPEDTMVTAAGGLPGETVKNWRVKAPNTFDCEFGFSCMGYEIAGAWGHAMAMDGKGVPIVMVGDGSYMMMNSDIYSSVLSGHKMIAVVCDNGGFGVINRLQTGMGVPGFNNLLKDARVVNKADPLHVDFAKHAEAMGLMHVTAKALQTSKQQWNGRNRPHHRDQHQLRCLYVDARRSRLACWRARDQRARKHPRGTQGSGSLPCQAAAGV